MIEIGPNLTKVIEVAVLALLFVSFLWVMTRGD